MKPGTYLIQLEFSDGVKKSPPDRILAARRRIMSVETIAVRKKLKTEIFLTLKKNNIRKQHWLVKSSEAVPARSAANIRIQPESSRAERA